MKNRLNLFLGLAIVALCIPLFALTGLNMEDPEKAGSDMCLGCHDDMEAKLAASIHGKLGEHEMAADDTCESCHGNGMAHAESDGEEPIPYPFNEETLTSDVNATCVTCHNGGETMEWHDSEHSASGLTCLDCHVVKAPYAKLHNMQINQQCAKCHSDQNAKFNLPSHHPVYEHRMSCNDCHNPHGGEETMLRADSANDLCLSCHADKHGPFMYEHEPVVEDCMICHDAKGGMHNNLLVANEASLCLRCHAGHEDNHPISHMVRNEARRGFMTKCTRCHSQIHGSDLPGFTGPSRFVR